MRRASTVFAILVTILVSAAISASAQPLVSSPASGQVFPAGQDYATDVLHDPWDFDNREDMSPFPDDHRGWVQWEQARSIGPAAFLTTPGWFSGTSNNGDAMLGLLFQGGILAATPGRSGVKYPINTAVYRTLSFKMRMNVGGAPTDAEVIWFTGPAGVTDGGSARIAPISQGDGVYVVDLGGTSWKDKPATGIRLDTTSVSGANVALDWVRLSAPATMPVRASNCGGGPHPISVRDAANVARLVHDGQGLGSTIDTTIDYGIFPPSPYPYQLEVNCSGATISVSFVINDPPRITILDPDERGGADYATTVRGAAAAWDMEHVTDVAALGNANQEQQVPIGDGTHMLRAVSTNGDPAVFVLYGEGASRPIATTRYRYLTYTLQVHEPFALSAEAGSMARILWGSRAGFDATNATTSEDILVWPGRHTYTIDLAGLNFADGSLEQCPPGGACDLWSTRSVRFLRVDPHEISYRPVAFDLDNVMLTAPDEAAIGSSFPIRWNIQDANADPDGYLVQIYADTDTNFGNGASLIGTVTAAAGPGQVLWSPDAPGEYYIHLRVTESLAGTAPQTMLRTSSGFLRVFSPAASQPTIVVGAPTPNGVTYAPFTMRGCAYNAAATSGTGVDEILLHAIPEADVAGGQPAWLGSHSAGLFGTQQNGLPCPTGPSGAGFAVSNISALAPGHWTFRVLARNVVTGDFDESVTSGVLVEWKSAPARNLRLVSAAGNNVTLAWDPPDAGRAVSAYRIEVATNPGFAPLAAQIAVPSNVTSGSGALANGTWYVRIITQSDYSTNGAPSNVLSFSLPGGGAPAPAAPPGAPTLSVVQGQVNPITLSWSAGSGGPPSSYILHAGTAPGASNLGTFNLTGQSGITAVAPAGITIYARLVASNSAGTATSNEVSFAVGGAAPPGSPSMNPASVSGRNVTLSWTAATGATTYTVLARLPGSPAIIATLAGLTGTSVAVPNVPPGSYVVTVVGVNGAGNSGESNAVTVVVP